MEAYIDIVFEGDRFFPTKLGEATALPIESIIEYGEIGKRGKYKGKPTPYGLGLIKIVGNSSQEFNDKLNIVFDQLLKKVFTLQKTGVQEIKLDTESSTLENLYIEIYEEIEEKILKLNSQVEILEAQSQFCSNSYINSIELQQKFINEWYESVIKDQVFHLTVHEKHSLDYLFRHKLNHIKILECHYSYNELTSKIFLYLFKYSKSKNLEKVPAFDEVLK